MLLLNELLAYKDKLDIVGLLPQKLCPPTPMAGFISTHASDPAGAKAFLEYLASPEAQALFKDAGFAPRS
jgi:ABC-type molybdate transport system substrate-binding protein